MRLFLLCTLTLLWSACSSSKKTQQPTTYDTARQPSTRPDQGPARERTVVTQRPLSADPSAASRPATTTRPVNPNAASGTAAPAETPSSDYVITALKGKFLAIDTTAARVYLTIYSRTPNGKPISDPADFASRFLVNYVLYPDYNNRERLGYGNVAVTAENLSIQGDHTVLTFDVKRPRNTVGAIMLTEITEVNSGKKALNDLQLRFQTTRLTDRYTLFDGQGRLPLLRNYVNRSDTVLIRDVSGASKPLYGFRYRHEFDAASSPMNTGTRPTPKTLDVDSTLTVMTNQPFKLPKEGLYFFLEDTTDTYGLGVIVADNRFPKLTRPEKLVKPVLYVSTSSEMNELNNSADPKKAFDKYWLSLMYRLSWTPDGRLLITDIGQAHIEEINIGRAGADYGWPVREGTFVINPRGRMDQVYALADSQEAARFTYPVAQYDHDEGKAISGGFVYTGTAIRALSGKYLFGDINSGRIFFVDANGLRQGKQAPIGEFGLSVDGKRTTFQTISGKAKPDVRFGMGVNGTLYVMTKSDGKIYRIRAAEPEAVAPGRARH